MNNMRWVYILLGLAAVAVVVTGVVVVTVVGLDLLGGGRTDELASPTPEIIPSGSISGLVWHDLCASGSPGEPAPAETPAGCNPLAGGGYGANGILEPGEPGLPGVLVRLGAGACPASGLADQFTNGAGRYAFTGLNPGTYCVSIDPGDARNAALLLPGNWSAPAGSGVAASTVNVLGSEQVSEINFGWDYQFLPPLPTATSTPTTTPTATVTPTPTRTPTPTPPPIPCDWVGFVKDVSVPDGTNFRPDQDFTKTWRLKNLGTCTWTRDYDLVFVSGDRMTGDKVTALKGSVKPGETVDISIELTAPQDPGKYTGYWALRSPAGEIFGMGPDADEAFWVIIRVEKPKAIVYSFVDHLCDAAWVSTSAEIACPSTDYSVDGFVQRVDNPVLEQDRQENEPGIWVYPEGVNGGRISGTFPAFRVKTGDRFRAVVSCSNESPECDLQFKLEYQIGDGEIKTLGRWDESYDGEFTKIDIDLSPLAGKDVRFILTVRAKDVFDQDSAIWLLPALYR